MITHFEEVIARAFFGLTDWIVKPKVEIEHRLFDSVTGAKLSPIFLSRDLPLIWECTPARREARWITVEPTYEIRRG